MWIINDDGLERHEMQSAVWVDLTIRDERSTVEAMPDMRQVVIVGASLAGLRAAETLRSDGFTGTITVIGAEDRRPYDRPPLSKKLLSGEWEPERIALRKADDLDSLDITWLLGSPATGVDLEGRTVTLANGAAVSFDGLIIATGSAARRLPFQPDWQGIHVLRTMDDALSLRSDIEPTSERPNPRVVVIGAGFIGLEVAATARGRGCAVTVLEGAEAPMMRGLGVDMGHAAALVHTDNGVDMRMGVSVAGFYESSTGRVGGVELSIGERVDADVVVIGVGAAPVTAWLEGSGLDVRDGVVCDHSLNAGVPFVYAAGDVCRWVNDLYGREMRIEHWTTASEQGAAAARNLLAEAAGHDRVPYAAVPFFWSDQFTARIQFLGRAEGDEVVHVVIGSPEERSFVALYERDGILVAALGVSKPRQLMPFRALIASRVPITEALEFAETLVT
jgi:NADPH-dependent 2,4-dienoyl-CoA reductase/sulfur reductase-like enzyme